MLKAAAFTTALLLSSAAIAQTDTDMTSSATPDTSTTWSNAATPTVPANPMAPSSGQTVAPDNSNPERDARGIAVISAPAVVPAGWNGTANSLTGTGGPELDTSGQLVAAASDLPPCSRTVTDHCVQTYERNRR